MLLGALGLDSRLVGEERGERCLGRRAGRAAVGTGVEGKAEAEMEERGDIERGARAVR
jgi:hypothetical protein